MNILKTSLIILVLLTTTATITASEENIIDMISDHDENRDGIVKVMVVDNYNGAIIIEYDVYVDTNKYKSISTSTQDLSTRESHSTPTPEMVEVPGFTVGGLIVALIGVLIVIRYRRIK